MSPRRRNANDTSPNSLPAADVPEGGNLGWNSFANAYRNPPRTRNGENQEQVLPVTAPGRVTHVGRHVGHRVANLAVLRGSLAASTLPDSKNLFENPSRSLKNASNYNSLSDPTSGFRIGSEDLFHIKLPTWTIAPIAKRMASNARNHHTMYGLGGLFRCITDG